ncbi:hypothetical protein SYNTR_0185 [Candidatus Syntrophocurvum alkaliphilum]|uniref:YknX-like C-terminal permuted SH3-like domain-containing protein n=1 Tax=Candidatus Syntrophocurvum alkaliphilum TaxID=2293317 RepID=A0A6I6DDV4_9FIRM|nr:efflux RND transporter periplasmic adaptor subunit [Candidatus Syntrophocurvum alkaliphilum]QGT98778.1 hypothetical protein SYNTR_0185 [Candidatus Syntrophocurvum alkaliphilum]
MKTKWKVVLGIIVGVVFVAIIVAQVTQGINVDVQKIESGDIDVSFNETGELVSEDKRNIYSMYSATINNIMVAEGSKVSKGELLATLEDTELNYKLNELESNLRSISNKKELNTRILENNLDVAEKNYERMKALYEKGAIPTVEIEEAEEALKLAEFDLKQNTVSLANEKEAIIARKNMLLHQKNSHNIYAPIDGVIASVDVKEGEISNPQTAIMKLLPIDGHSELLVESTVLTQDVNDLYNGLSVNLTFERRNEDLVFAGKVIGISPYAKESYSPLGLEEERVKITILPDIPEGANLAPGYKLDVEFITKEESDVLAVPKNALFTYEGEDALFIVDNNRAKVQEVITGIESRRDVVIKEGLSKNDLVITNPQVDGLSDGSRVSYE